MGLTKKNRKSRSKKTGGKRKTNKPTIFSRFFSRKGGTNSKRVVFKNCNSDMDCTLDKPECDTKNNICIQKFKYIGGKTRKKMKKRCTIDNNIIY